MDRRHEDSFIEVWDDQSAVKRPSPHAGLTGVITFNPGFKGPTANGTAWLGDFNEITKAGTANGKTGPFRIHLSIPEEISADGAPGGIDEVEEVI